MMKIGVLGDAGVGKSALSIRLCSNQFGEDYDPTTPSVDVFRATLTIDDVICMVELHVVAGLEDIVGLIHDCDAFVLIYSITSSASFKQLISIREQSGLDLTVTRNNIGGQTAVYLAAEHGHVEVIEALVGELGSMARVDCPAENGTTALHFLAEQGNARGIERVVGLGCRSVDACNEVKWTPMHVAARNGRVEVVRPLFLLGSPGRHGSRRNGATTLDLSRLGNSDECTSLLEVFSHPDQLATRQVMAGEVAALRYQLHFADSLVHRLLAELEALHHQQQRHNENKCCIT